MDKKRKTIAITAAVAFLIIIIGWAAIYSINKSNQQRITELNTPAKINQVINGWSYTSSNSNTTISHNGKVVTSGSTFTVSALQKLGVPKQIQAAVFGSTVANLASIEKQQSQPLNPQHSNPCVGQGTADNPGYSNFQQIKTNGQWALDDTALSLIEADLTPILQAQNQTLPSDQQVICVDAQLTNDAQVTNPYVNVVTTWQVKYYTTSGSTTTHTMTFTTDMNYKQTVTLDGQEI